MPLATRYVEPRSVCANPLLTEEATRAGDALQAVSVRSTAGLIRQLGSLARHAESVMGELADSLASCHARTLDLERRTRVLAVEVLPGLDPDREVLEGFEIPHPDLQFKSSKTIDQRILSQQSSALLEQYGQARAPPDLAQFSTAWEDGRNAMHVYSKPDFFFENWREEIQQQAMRKMSQMDMLSPKHEGEGDKKKKKRRILEASTGSDKVSSFVKPVKRTFSLSRKPHPHKSIHGSTQSLITDPGYSTMPSYPGRQGHPRRSSPSLHSASPHPRQSHHHNQVVVMRSQSLRHKTRRRPRLHSLASTTASLYVEHSLDIALPNTATEENSQYQYETRPQKKSLGLRRSHSFQKTRSKSPVPGVSTNSVLDSLHMYTVAKELAKLGSSPFGLLSKQHLEHLDLGSSSFETCLAIEPLKKENTTFRTPIGMRQRPVSSLDMQLVALRNDGAGASRSSSFRLKHLSAADVPTVGFSSRDEWDSLHPGGNGPLFGLGGVILRHRHINMTGPNSQPRPVSASFVDPPTVKKVGGASRLSLQQIHGGSLTDLTRPESPAHSESPSPKIRPKRPAPQAPGGRPLSRTGTPDSGRSTPKGFRTQSPLVGYQASLPSLPSLSQSSHETLTGLMTPNGRVTPTGSPIIKNHFPFGPAFEQHRVAPPISSPPKILGLHRNTSSPQLPSPPQLLPMIQRNTSSPQLPLPPQLLPMIQRNTSSPQLPMIPIQEEEMPTVIHRPPEIITPSSPPVVVVMMNGHVPAPPPLLLRRDSLYISPRKQSLTLGSADKKRLRASQILETGGIRGGDLSSSRLDLLDAIRKGIQLKEVEKKEREKENMVSMPWDVAAILERRLAMESESDSSEEESNDTEWLDED